jgi:hypothetical protein
MNDIFQRFGRFSLGWVATPLLVSSVLLAGCAGYPSSQPAATAPHSASAVPKATELSPYFDTLEKMAPGDPSRQAAELASVLGAAQQSPTSTNRLRYAITLGAAGHADSNPVEAKRLITELLAGQHDLKPSEVSLANAYLREFDARVALYADIARQREELERRLQSAGADDDRRYASMAAENAKLKKALAEAERKLEAVAEMERTLIEQNGTAPPPGDRTPPRP